ncbi:MAG: DUF6292 family protein [Streptosporangiaceae bacterium]
MSAQQGGRADHSAYIAAVCRGIEARDMRVADLQVTTSADSRREASVVLCPDADAFAERVPGEATASWDEDNGWSLLASADSPATQVHKGLGVLPGPEDVAAWAVVLLTHPELTPSREDCPFRDHSVPDPEFEAHLASYVPAT